MEDFFTLDYGNTHPHLGPFKNAKLQDVIPFTPEYLTQQGHPTLVISQVGPTHSFIKNYPGTVLDYTQYRETQNFAGMPIHYSESLGSDRLLQGYYLYQHCILEGKLTHLIHIDAGTFTTVNMITDKGFMGGPIFLGAQTYLDTYPRSEKLPKLQYRSFRPTAHLPQTTHAAIQSAWELYIQGTIEACERRFGIPPLTIISGGHCEVYASYLEEKKSPYEARPHLIHQALAHVHLNAGSLFGKRTP